MGLTIDTSKDDPMGFFICYGARAVFCLLIIAILFMAADSLGFKISNLSFWYNVASTIVSFMLGLLLGANLKK